MTSPFTQLFLPAAVVVVMFALGTTLTLDDLRRVLARPRAFVLGSLLRSPSGWRSRSRFPRGPPPVWC